MSTVEIADLEQIVQTVRQEHDYLRGGRKRGIRIGAFQRTAFLLLQIVAYSIPVALAAALVVAWAGGAGGLPALVLWAWSIVGVVFLVPLVLLNLPLIATAWRQHRLIVGRGLLEPTLPAWQLKARWPVAAVTAVGGLLAFTVKGGGTIFALVLVVVSIPFLMLLLKSFLALAERNLDLLRDVKELQEVLEDKLAEARRTSAKAVDLPHALAVRVSDTAAGIRGNQRLRAIGASMKTPHSEFSVIQSKTVRERLEGFSPEGRLQLLDRIQGLATNRHPQGARHDEAAGRWIWSLGEPDVEVVYEVAEDEKQVLLSDVRQSTSAGGTVSDGSG